MKSIISTLAVLALATTIVPANTVSRSVASQAIVPPPTCPADITQPCGPTPDDAGRTITIGGGFAPVQHGLK